MTQMHPDSSTMDRLHEAHDRILDQLSRVIVGQKQVVEELLISLFSRGHCLLEGVPGLAKTLLVSTLAKSLDLSFSRIQFTPDLMPSDITGTNVLEEAEAGNRHFRFVEGPVFTNVLLADEINRTPPKTQAAMLQAMQEHEVTIGQTTYPLPDPFFVIATQNPIEQEGTYPLPEAQLDRFMFNIVLDYPAFEAELQIVRATTSDIRTELSKVIGGEEIVAYQHVIRRIPVTDTVLQYAVGLVTKTRPNTEKADARSNQYLSWGAGPRASQYLILGAKCHAAINGKYAPDIEDVKAVALPVLRHRIVRNYKAEADGVSVEDIIRGLM